MAEVPSVYKTPLKDNRDVSQHQPMDQAAGDRMDVDWFDLNDFLYRSLGQVMEVVDNRFLVDQSSLGGYPGISGRPGNALILDDRDPEDYYGLYVAQCEFDLADIISVQDPNALTLSDVDGKLYVSFSCNIDAEALIEPESDNLLKPGPGGLLYVPPQEQCTIDVEGLVSPGDNYIIVDPDTGLLKVEPFTCNVEIPGLISQTHVPNILSTDVTGDGLLYVDPADVRSGTAGNAITLDANNKLLLLLASIISGDAGNLITQGTDGGLLFTGLNGLISSTIQAFDRVGVTYTAPDAGVWAILGFTQYLDNDLPTNAYLGEVWLEIIENSQPTSHSGVVGYSFIAGYALRLQAPTA